MKLYDCGCEYQEIENNVADSSAKGYALEKECDVCKAKRELQAEESAKQRRRQEIIAELNELDRKAMRPLLDNETERIEEIKTKKIALREELHGL